ncbi:hypothetical protein RB653_001427 [Dictyostelium firmibasis]|uniref:Cysteine protease n=1 Tax=Dictyostelium firmibasis TaxID=79012 RepID=A0AAN7U465_9MYCE
MMNCLYLIRGAGNTLSQPQFSNSPIWMFDNEYRPSLAENLLKLNQLITTINNINSNIGENSNNIQPSIANTTATTNTAAATTTISPVTADTQENETNDVSNDNVNNNNNNSSNNINNSNNYENNNIDPSPITPTINTSQENNQNQLFIKEFLNDFTTRVLWFTYRQGFPCIDNTMYDNDCGWGCMLRSGQMLLSNVLLHNVLGNDWKGSSSTTHTDVYNNIISMFLDKPSAPFSIHNIAMEGQNLGKNIGEWFAPSIISQAIKILVSRNYEQCKISVFISEDGSLYIDQLLNISSKKKKISSAEQQKESDNDDDNKKHNEGMENIKKNIDNNNNNKMDDSNVVNEKEAKHKGNDEINQENNNNDDNEDYDNNDETWEPLLILIPMRLGLDGLNSIYHSSLLEIFKFPQNLGVVGGKPRASLYFIAAQDDNLFYLDPHTVQNHIEVENGSKFPLNTFFCSTTKRTHVSEVDPSLVVAFFCKTKDDFNDFVERSKKMTSQMENPIFSIFDNEPDYDSSRDCEYEEIDETGGETSDDIDIETDYHMM